MVENKWVNSGIAVAIACVLTGLAVWMSSRQPVEQLPTTDRPAQVDGDAPAAPADRLGPRPPDGVVENETKAPPPDMGGLKPPTKD